jgi:hypothetical protein
MTGEPWVPLPPEAVETENVGSRPADYCVACGYPRPGRVCPNCRVDQTTEPEDDR